MHHEMVFVDADADQVTPTNPEQLGEASHPCSLVCIDCVERVVAAGEGADFYNHGSRTVTAHDVDFAASDDDVAGDYLETVLVEVETGEELAELSDGQSA